MKWNRKSKSPQSVLHIFVRSPRGSNDTNEQLTSDSVNTDQMSVGIHFGPKTTDGISATWPKMKRSELGSGDTDVARIVRPQTATLERPRILDVTLLGKIDMSLTRKSLLSISNLCIAPLDNMETFRDAKRNATSNRETLHGGKTRKWNTPRRSMGNKNRVKQVKHQCKVNGCRTDESWDEDESSVSETSLGARKVSKDTTVSRSPSRGTPVKLEHRHKRISPVNSISSNANSPRRTFVNPAQKEKRLSPVSNATSSPSRVSGGKTTPTDKRVSPVSSISNATNSPSSRSVVKNVPREKQVSAVGNGDSSSNMSQEVVDKPGRKTCKRPVIVKKDGKNVHEAFGGPKPSDEVPEPCRTCGRPEQPERFHSHPPPSSHRQSSAARRQQDDNNNNHHDVTTKPAVTKSSVRKPVPINYRSGKSNRRKCEATKGAATPPTEPTPDPLTRNSCVGPGSRTAEMQPVDRKSPKNSGGGVFLVLDDRPTVKSGPRTVLCYLCGREFGTASYPLHEPHCLQRWERENAKLPPHQQRAAPEKPANPLTVEQWNAFAWEASQAHLVPCENCGRTFKPDSLQVHQRSCRPVPGQVSKRGSQQEQQEVRAPPAVYCYICGKMFGTRSIGIHEPQCLDRWRLENDQLPAHQRRPEPMKPQTRLTTARTLAVTVPQNPEEAPKDPRLVAAPHVMVCYLCGLEFDTRVLNKHEDDCFKQWRKWNDSLPTEQRRPEPERPQFKFNKATGNVDCQATMDAIWQEHLKSLVPCSLGCGRTFNPDRVAVHERGCKGPRK